jgi:hypothetical protein
MLSLNVLSIDSASICLISDILTMFGILLRVAIWVYTMIVALSLDRKSNVYIILARGIGTPPR